MYWVTISKSCMQWVVCKLFFSPDKWRDWVNIKYGLIGLTSCIWVVISSSKFKILNYHIFQKETPKLKRNNTIFFFWKEINNHYIEKKEREKFFHRTWKKSITLIDVLNLKKFKCILKRLDNMSTFSFSGYYFSFYFFVFVRLRKMLFFILWRQVVNPPKIRNRWPLTVATFHCTEDRQRWFILKIY